MVMCISGQVVIVVQLCSCSSGYVGEAMYSWLGSCGSVVMGRQRGRPSRAVAAVLWQHIMAAY